MAGGIKMANGTNSIRGSGGSPGTRGKSAALVRAQFIKAQRYREKLAKGGDDPPERDLAMEALVEAGEATMTALVTAADDFARPLVAAQRAPRLAQQHLGVG